MKEIPRTLKKQIISYALKSNKMAFITGPRQVGKTTLAGQIGKLFSDPEYYNWDDIEFRRTWKKNPSSLTKKSDLLIFDEIHKSKNWKTGLKGLYDRNPKTKYIVTGSAKLDFYKKAGDSLFGRFYPFRLHPLTVGELRNNNFSTPEGLLKKLFNKNVTPPGDAGKIYKKLYDYGGFPHTYTRSSQRHLSTWHRLIMQLIIREDLRDLTRVIDLSQIEMLAALLIERTSSPLSIKSLSEDLEVSPSTIPRWLKMLESVYYHFHVLPYTKNIIRAIRKNNKIYFWDWTLVRNKGARFENLVALHLLKSVNNWSEFGYGNFNLHFIRDKEKREVDFLITENNKPWLLIECKYSDTSLSKHLLYYQKKFSNLPAVQVVHTDRVFRMQDPETIIINASSFLSYFN